MRGKKGEKQDGKGNKIEKLGMDTKNNRQLHFQSGFYHQNIDDKINIFSKNSKNFPQQTLKKKTRPDFST